MILIAAFSVHILTAAGAALGLAALLAASDHRWTAMFSCLGAALIVDGVDGAIARRVGTAQRLPRWSGDVLDLVVDFVTYVFVPAYAIAVSGLLPPEFSAPAGFLIVITGAIYFADRDMKTPDHYFRGFPALWNAAAFYLFILKPTPWVSAAAVVLLAVLTFVPFKFLHPFRVKRYRTATAVVLTSWAVLAVTALFLDLQPGPWVTGALVALGLYFVAVGLTSRRDRHDRIAG